MDTVVTCTFMCRLALPLSGFGRGLLVTCPDSSMDLQEQRARLSGKIDISSTGRSGGTGNVHAGAFVNWQACGVVVTSSSHRGGSAGPGPLQSMCVRGFAQPQTRGVFWEDERGSPGIMKFPEVSNCSQLDKAAPAASLTEIVVCEVRARLLRLCQGESQASGGSAKVEPLRWAWGLKSH